MKRSTLRLVVDAYGLVLVLQAEIAAGFAEGLRAIAATVVGHDPRRDGGKAGVVVGDCGLEEGDGVPFRAVV